MKFRVWFERFDYRNKQILNGEILDAGSLDKLIGETLRETGKVENVDLNSYVFRGEYQSAGGDYLPFGYRLDYEPLN